MCNSEADNVLLELINQDRDKKIALTLITGVMLPVVELTDISKNGKTADELYQYINDEYGPLQLNNFYQLGWYYQHNSTVKLFDRPIQH